MRAYLQLYPYKPDGETTVLHYLDEHNVNAIVDSSHNVDGLYTADETSDLKYAVKSFNDAYKGKYFISIIFRAMGNQPLPDSKIIGNKNYKPNNETANDEKDFPKPPPPKTENGMPAENPDRKSDGKKPTTKDSNLPTEKEIKESYQKNKVLWIAGGLVVLFLLFKD